MWKILKNNKLGFSLVEVMIASAMLGAGVLAYMQMQSSGTKETKLVESRASATLMAKEIADALIDPDICSAAFHGRDPRSGFVDVIGSGGTAFKRGAKYINDTIQLEPTNPFKYEDKDLNGYLTITFYYRFLSPVLKMKDKTQGKKIDAKIRYSAPGGLIDKCALDPGDALEGLVKQACEMISGTLDSDNHCNLNTPPPPSAPGIDNWTETHRALSHRDLAKFQEVLNDQYLRFDRDAPSNNTFKQNIKIGGYIRTDFMGEDKGLVPLFNFNQDTQFLSGCSQPDDIIIYSTNPSNSHCMRPCAPGFYPTGNVDTAAGNIGCVPFVANGAPPCAPPSELKLVAEADGSIQYQCIAPNIPKRYLCSNGTFSTGTDSSDPVSPQCSNSSYTVSHGQGIVCTSTPQAQCAAAPPKIYTCGTDGNFDDGIDNPGIVESRCVDPLFTVASGGTIRCAYGQVPLAQCALPVNPGAMCQGYGSDSSLWNKYKADSEGTPCSNPWRLQYFEIKTSDFKVGNIYSLTQGRSWVETAKPGDTPATVLQRLVSNLNGAPATSTGYCGSRNNSITFVSPNRVTYKVDYQHSTAPSASRSCFVLDETECKATGSGCNWKTTPGWCTGYTYPREQGSCSGSYSRPACVWSGMGMGYGDGDVSDPGCSYMGYDAASCSALSGQGCYWGSESQTCYGGSRSSCEGLASSCHWSAYSNDYGQCSSLSSETSCTTAGGGGYCEWVTSVTPPTPPPAPTLYKYTCKAGGGGWTSSAAPTGSTAGNCTASYDPGDTVICASAPANGLCRSPICGYASGCHLYKTLYAECLRGGGYQNQQIGSSGSCADETGGSFAALCSAIPACQ